MPLEVVVATIAVQGEGRPDGSQGNVFFLVMSVVEGLKLETMLCGAGPDAQIFL